ncbi:hypothetical protein BLA29_009406 [Euroglyphus maynei]|uniref:Uncharacterized protein n=1 Tax=Euroglyphus maynei TaxID=6958 RepID=A0A1Y3B1W3_EURMA|nr:hypothetical protein BLA29_009406 [Euroglyphus maynei]
MQDDTISERDKLKWIKQFKMYHPDVYDVYFTNNCNMIEQCKQKSNVMGKRNRTRSSHSIIDSSLKSDNGLFKRFFSLKIV